MKERDPLTFNEMAWPDILPYYQDIMLTLLEAPIELSDWGRRQASLTTAAEDYLKDNGLAEEYGSPPGWGGEVNRDRQVYLRLTDAGRSMLESNIN